MTKFSNKILKKPIFAPFSTFLGQFFFKSSSVTHNTTWASNTMKKIVFSEKTNEAIPKKLPDGQVQTHRTLPFQKKPGVQKGIKIWTYTHARPQTYKHAWTQRERESHILKYSNWSNTTWSDLPCFWMVHRSLLLSSLSYYFHDLTSHNLLNK